MMAKSHLKRINAPKTWPIARKQSVYIMRPNPSGHAMERGVTLSLLFTEMLDIAQTARGVRYILKNQKVLLNGHRQYDAAAMVGLFDVVTIPATKTSYRLTINKLNKLTAIPVAGKEAQLIPCKITSKTLLSGKKLQLGFHNGQTLLVAKDQYMVGGTILLTLEKKEETYFPLEKGALVFITGGRHVGQQGTVELIDDNGVIVKTETSFLTTKEHVFVLGKGKAAFKTE